MASLAAAENGGQAKPARITLVETLKLQLRAGKSGGGQFIKATKRKIAAALKQAKKELASEWINRKDSQFTTDPKLFVTSVVAKWVQDPFVCANRAIAEALARFVAIATNLVPIVAVLCSLVAHAGKLLDAGALIAYANPRKMQAQQLLMLKGMEKAVLDARPAWLAVVRSTVASALGAQRDSISVAHWCNALLDLARQYLVDGISLSMREHRSAAIVEPPKEVVWDNPIENQQLYYVAGWFFAH